MIQIYSIWEKYFYISAYQSSKLVFIRFILLMNGNSSSWGADNENYKHKK